MKLPYSLSDKAAEFPECSHGATKVTLILKNNQKIENVILAWGGEIVKIGGMPIDQVQDIDFTVDDIIDILHEESY